MSGSRSTASRRTFRAAGVAVFTLSALLLATVTSAEAASPPRVALAGSEGAPADAAVLGPHSLGSQLLITLVLAPRAGSAMDQLIAQLTDPGSPLYQDWLPTGAFDQRFEPDQSTRDSASRFLTEAGLRIADSPSPFLIRATGTTAQVESAFATTISDYRSDSGTDFYTNGLAATIPATLSGLVIGVSGLSSTVRHHPAYVTAASVATNGKAPAYGAGPGGSGLTPKQIEGVYGAGKVHALANGKGQGTTLGLFELSGYTQSDIKAYETQFFGPSEDMPIDNVNVDGGPVHPNCPTGDSCGPFGAKPCQNGCDGADYSGDIEVEADVEAQIAMAPGADKVMVYNAPNDFNGATTVDELFKIANDNAADVISSSWGLCEVDNGLGTAEAEYVALAQIAAQGQSFFGAAGDDGAFDCLGDPKHKGLNVDDPPAQPYVTAVGGTSLGTFDPGSDESITYPAGSETVWNPLDACQRTYLHGCSFFGAGGGGVSKFWARPAFQTGPGVQSSFSRVGPYCSQASDGQACREIPDVSANADEYSPYAEECTGAKTTTGAGASYCASFVDETSPRGWFGIGGTSLSSPLWSAIVDLWVGVHHQRFGQANVRLYQLFRSNAGDFFHDITGFHQTETNNGWFPVTKNYDMAVGIGSPQVSAIALSH